MSINEDWIAYASIDELSKAYQSKILSPVDVTKTLLDRIDLLNPIYNAYISVSHERALEDAKKAELQIQAGEKNILCGISFSVKDLTPVENELFTRGSLLHKNDIAKNSAEFVKRLINLGAIFLGKTNTSEYGYKGDTSNRIMPSSLNPFDTRYSSGGSSGGAATAIALGMCTIAHGSDAAGSIRIPSSMSGIFGLKPTFGRIPNVAVHPSLKYIVSAGPMTRSVRDSSIMLDAMSGYNTGDTHTYLKISDSLSIPRSKKTKYKIAYCSDLGFGTAEPEVKDRIDAAIMSLTKDGHEVEIVEPKLDLKFQEAFNVIFSHAHAGLHEQEKNIRKWDLIDEGRKYWINKGKEITSDILKTANDLRIESYSKVEDMLFGYDFLITPTSPIAAIKPHSIVPDQYINRHNSVDWMIFTWLFNLSGHPAANIPCGFSNSGLPIGLHAIARHGDEPSLFQLCSSIEFYRPWLDDLKKINVSL